jgi:EAL domain-containing protein (putative c-di-GMP-specific phosphodiesterase class I)
VTLTPPARTPSGLPGRGTPALPASGSSRPRPSEVLSAGLDRNRRVREQVEQLIAEPSRLGPDFSPIRRLDGPTPSTGTVVGWKAVGRGAPGTEVADTLSLLEQASRLGLVERLDWAFRCHAFDVAMDSGLTGELHLTPEPETFGGACPPRLAVAWLRGRRALNVFAELHEDSFVDRERLRAAAEEMVGWGWHLVVADVSGTAAAATAESMLGSLRPAYVQVDLGRPHRDDLGSRRLLDAARDVGASVLAVGISTQADLDLALELGAVAARGPLIGAVAAVPR